MPRRPLKKTDGPTQLLTVRDVAQLNNVSEKTVRRAIAAGLLDSVRLGRLVRIEPRALEIYRRYRGD